MGNDGEMSGEVRRGHDITRLKKIGMKGEQGVRDPAGVGVVHGKVALDRWCISFEYICMQVTVRLLAVSTPISYLPCCFPSLLPPFPPSLSSSSSSLTSVLSRALRVFTLLSSSAIAQSAIPRKETFEQAFVPVRYMYVLPYSIQTDHAKHSLKMRCQ